MLLHWLKVFHLYAVIVALGSAAAQLLLLWYHQGDSNKHETRTSEAFAFFLSRRLEIPALTLAVLLGLSIAILHGGYWKAGWFHAKIAIALILLGVSHMAAATLRRVGRLRDASASEAPAVEERITALKWRLQVLGFASVLLVIIILYLVTVKPF